MAGVGAQDLHNLRQFHHLSPKKKLQTLDDCQRLLEDTFHVRFSKLTEIVRLVPVYFHGPSDFTVRQGQGCLSLFLKEDLHLKRGELKILKISLKIHLVSFCSQTQREMRHILKAKQQSQLQSSGLPKIAFQERVKHFPAK